MSMKKNIVAMIPARLGSKRVPKKNLREINGKPLICYIIEAAIASGEFDEIYINSESEEFKKFADQYCIKFYKRPEHLATDNVTNDAFMEDFMKNTKCDAVIQLLPTSPFITPETISNFVDRFKKDKLLTLISVKNVQIECVYEGKPVNFDQNDITLPSQQLKPIQAYACGIMGWDKETFLNHMESLGAAYHGGDASVGKGYFVLKGYETVDIDEEDDFKIAEVIAKIEPKKIIIPLNKVTKSEAVESLKNLMTLYKEELHIESDVPIILAKDGVEHNDLHDANKEIVSVQSIIDSMPKDKSWSKRLVDTESNSMCLICQFPGEGNRRHYHADWNEWWYIVQGEWIFEIEGEKKIVKKGDVVFIAKNRVHRIEASGNGPAIRMAVSRADVGHIYVDHEIIDPTLFNRMLR